MTFPRTWSPRKNGKPHARGGLLPALFLVVGPLAGCSGPSTPIAPPPRPPAGVVGAGESVEAANLPPVLPAAELMVTEIDIPLKATSTSAPVAAGVGIGPAPATAGELVVLVVRVHIAPSWHIYPTDFDPSTAPMIPTGLALHLPEGIRVEGDWGLPRSHTNPISMLRVLDGEIEFRHLLRIDQSLAPGEYQIGCDLSFQVCDPVMCLPPETRNLVVFISVAADYCWVSGPGE